MNAEQIFDILREAMLVTLIISGPPMAIGLVVGVAISLVQAMTQIQEMTLTFVPKLIVLFITMIVFMPFMLATIVKFTEYIFDQIIAGGDRRMPLPQFLPAEIFAFLAVFIRLGAAFVVLPAFGEAVVPGRLRLLMALAITLVVVPIVRQTLPPMPDAPGQLLAFIFTESAIGFFLGGIARLLVTTLDLAGTIISTQIGLSTATVFNPALQSTGSLPSVLLSLGGLVAILETNLHHMLLEGLVDSYTLFRPTDPLPVGDLSDTVARLVADSFRVGLQIAAPFIVLSLLFTFALGLISRLMPSLQIFFVSVPAQLVGGMLIMIVSLSAMMTAFLTYYHETLVGLIVTR